MNASEEIFTLGRARADARARKDFAAADLIRAQILALGWDITDKPDGFELLPKPLFPMVSKLAELKPVEPNSANVSVAMVVDSFCEDAARAIASIKKYSQLNIPIIILVTGTPDTTSLLNAIDGRTHIFQVSPAGGWGECANTLLRIAPTSTLIIMDPSTEFVGDAITPVMEKFSQADSQQEWSAIGWKGGLVDIEDQWRTVKDRGPGEVDVLFGYFMAMNRESAIEAGGFSNRATYYRNADMEFSLRLREVKGRLLQLDLPLIQTRHHGYYDIDPEYRDLQSKKNYDRILERFRGKTEILSPRR
jgi:hypothetical protein